MFIYIYICTYHLNEKHQLIHFQPIPGLLQLTLTEHAQPLLINETAKARQKGRGGAVQLLVQLEVTQPSTTAW